jgi:hypothetical protein
MVWVAIGLPMKGAMYPLAVLQYERPVVRNTPAHIKHAVLGHVLDWFSLIFDRQYM